MNEPRVHHGFTLVELLAALALVGLLAGILLANVGSRSRDASYRAAVSALQDLDRRARVVATINGPLVLQIDRDGTTLTAAPAGSPTTTISDLSTTMPRDVQIECDFGPSNQLRIDRTGRSADYTVIVRMWEPSTETAWRVHGLTGAISRDDIQ